MENFKTIEKSQAACIMANLLSAEHKMSEIRSRGRVDIDRVVYDTASLEVAERTIELCEVQLNCKLFGKQSWFISRAIDASGVK
jgi:hypothetical protein